MACKWHLKHQIKEEHGKEVYGIAFNETCSRLCNLFATAGGEQVSIYSLETQTSIITLVHAYIVEKGREHFYVVKWMRLSDDTSIILAAGDRGPIHVIDTTKQRQTFLLLGHGNSIVRPPLQVEFEPCSPDALSDRFSQPTCVRGMTKSTIFLKELIVAKQTCRHCDSTDHSAAPLDDGQAHHRVLRRKRAYCWPPTAPATALQNDLETHPTQSDLLLSCSKDESIRLWDVKKRVPLIVFSGSEAHSGEVLFVSFHGIWDTVFASSGMDDAVKIWSWANRTPFLDHTGMAADLACQIESPLFTSTALHGDYVDCIHWLGDVLVSKSVDNRLVMWKPSVDLTSLVTGNAAPLTAFVVLREFDIPNCSLWYIHFAISLDNTTMACGNRVGGIHVWNLEEDGTGTSVQRMQCRAHVPVRIVQFHAEGRHLVAGLEDGTVCVYACSGPSKAAGDASSLVDSFNNTAGVGDEELTGLGVDDEALDEVASDGDCAGMPPD